MWFEMAESVLATVFPTSKIYCEVYTSDKNVC